MSFFKFNFRTIRLRLTNRLRFSYEGLARNYKEEPTVAPSLNPEARSLGLKEITGSCSPLKPKPETRKP